MIGFKTLAFFVIISSVFQQFAALSLGSALCHCVPFSLGGLGFLIIIPLSTNKYMGLTQTAYNGELEKQNLPNSKTIF